MAILSVNGHIPELNSIQKTGRASLVLLFPILWAIAPRLAGDIFALFHLVLVIWVLASCVLLYGQRVRIGTRYVLIGTLLFVMMGTIILSACINTSRVGLRDMAVIGRPVSFLIVFTFGYIAASGLSVDVVIKSLVKAAKVVLIIETLVSIASLLNIGLISLLYEVENAESGGQYRIQGTMGNPNLFGWLIIQCALMIIVFDRSLRWKVFSVVLVVSLILQSGSRSMIATILVGIFICLILTPRSHEKRGNSRFRWAFGVVATAGLTGVVYLVITRLSDRFPYLSQLTNIFLTGDLRSVNSFDARIDLWTDAWVSVTAQGTFLHLLFGYGPGTLPSVDNDALFSIVNYGVVFWIVNVILYICIYLMMRKEKDSTISVYVRQYIILTALIGFQADTLSGWNYPMLVLFTAGLACQLMDSRTNVLQGPRRVGTLNAIRDTKITNSEGGQQQYALREGVKQSRYMGEDRGV